MSVRIVNFAAAGGKFTVQHDELGHGGDIAPNAISFGLQSDGTPDRTMLCIPCPVCPVVSDHPITGGADAQSVQRLFAYIFMTFLTLPAGVANALGVPATPPRTWAQAKVVVKAAVVRVDSGAWKLEEVNQGG